MSEPTNPSSPRRIKVKSRSRTTLSRETGSKASNSGTSSRAGFRTVQGGRSQRAATSTTTSATARRRKKRGNEEDTDEKDNKDKTTKTSTTKGGKSESRGFFGSSVKQEEDIELSNISPNVSKNPKKSKNENKDKDSENDTKAVKSTKKTKENDDKPKLEHQESVVIGKTMPVHGKVLHPFWFTTLILKAPCFFFLLFLAIPLAMGGTAYYLFPDVHIDFGIGGFRIRDHFVAEREDGMSAAQNTPEGRPKNQTSPVFTTSSVVSDPMLSLMSIHGPISKRGAITLTPRASRKRTEDTKESSGMQLLNSTFEQSTLFGANDPGIVLDHIQQDKSLPMEAPQPFLIKVAKQYAMMKASMGMLTTPGRNTNSPRNYGNQYHMYQQTERHDRQQEAIFEQPMSEEQRLKQVDEILEMIRPVDQQSVKTANATTGKRTTATWSINIIYAATEADQDMLTEKYLRLVRQFELAFVKATGYKKYCWRADNYAFDCLPPHSILNFFYPTNNTATGSTTWDGRGERLADIQTTLLGILKSGNYFYVDKTFNRDNMKSTFLRSTFHFGAPLEGFASSKDRIAAQEALYTAFVNQYIELVPKITPKGITASFGGDFVTQSQLLQTFLEDIQLAMISLGAVFLLLWIHTRSLLISAGGMTQIMMSFPAVYAIYRGVIGVKVVGVMNGLSIFIILGIGVDDIFIFVDHFRQSGTITRDINARMGFTYTHSGKAMLITSLTTAGAFAANIVSEIPAIRLFGIFMSLMVSMNYFLVMTLFPSIVCIHYKYFGRCGSCICIRDSHDAETGEILTSSDDKSGFCSCCGGRNDGNDSDSDTDSDVESHIVKKPQREEKVKPLTSIFDKPEQDAKGPKGPKGPKDEDENDEDENDEEATDAKGDVKDTKIGPAIPNTKSYGRSTLRLKGINAMVVASESTWDDVPTTGIELGCFERFFRDTYTDALYKGRFAVIAVFLALAVVGGVFTAQMKPADELPKFFPPDHNIQRYTDQITKFTETGTCRVCLTDTSEGNGCDGVPNSGKVVDRCNVCDGDGTSCLGCNGQPFGPSYDRCGVCGGDNACVGCDGEPNSGAVADRCGVCQGNGLSCLGCDNVLNSGKRYDACGVCDGDGSTCRGCDGVPASGKVYDSCGVCGGLDASQDACGVCSGDNSTCIGCDGNVASGLVYDACGVCGGNNATCAGCDRIPNSGSVYDACGVCAGTNSTCAGCDNVPNSGLVFDACGVCNGNNGTCLGCDGVAASGNVYDACGVCGGTNSTCAGCDGIANSGAVYDICGVCNGDNSTCTQLGCDGINNSGKVYDACGVCGGTNTTCLGCDGNVNSGLVYDACGVCNGNNGTCLGCNGVPGSGLVYDACGVCGGTNSTCAGCDGVPNSGLVYDQCGLCGGDSATCRDFCGVINGDNSTCQTPVNNTSLVTKITLDGSVSTFNETKFIEDLAISLNVSIDKIKLKSVKSGSIIIVVEIEDNPTVTTTNDVDNALQNQNNLGYNVSSVVDEPVGCDGVVQSGTVVDACGVCGGDNSTCIGCDLVVNSTLRYDACGVCGGNNGTCNNTCDGIPGSKKYFDICNVCGGDNSTCLGCNGVPNSGLVYDACGVCNGNNATCTGCDGVANSGLVYDGCGVCNGTNSTCAGCDGIPNSGLVNDACGVCNGNNATCSGCDGIPNSGLVYDACGVCGGNNGTCAGCNGVANSGLVYDACGVCNGNNATCSGCDGIANSGLVYDICGVCNGNNGTCRGCDGVLFSGLVYDACGVCNGTNSTCLGCNGVPNSGLVYDACGVCGGNNASCSGCDGIANSGLKYDACGVCGGTNTTCIGCDGIVASGLVYDVCGVCNGNNGTCAGCDGVANSGLVYDGCGVCNGTNSTCFGCDGVAFSGLVFDGCGVCNGTNSTCADCLGIPYGTLVLDACGVCNGTNSTCLGCDGVPNSGLEFDSCGICGGLNATKDDCGVCGGTNSTCAGCDGIPYSGLKFDVCGVCEGTNACFPDPPLELAKVRVTMVWGLTGIDRTTADNEDPVSENVGSALYDKTFRLSDPAAQQAVYDTCFQAANSTVLTFQATQAYRCAMLSYRAWILQKTNNTMTFPIQDEQYFLDTFDFFVAGSSQFRRDVRFEYDSTGHPTRVKYHTAEFLTNAAENLASFVMLPYYDRWESFVSERNSKSPDTANKAYQTSSNWVVVFTEVVAVNGTVYGIAISLMTAFFVMFIFIGSFRIAAFAIMTIGSITLCMLGFFVLQGWTLGAVEAISISMLVGLSVDYCLHLGEAYSESGKEDLEKTRLDRIRDALTQMGVSMFVSSVTTIGSAIILIFCQIRVFNQFGIIIAVTLSLSIVFALTLFAALLAAGGPLRKTGDLRSTLIACAILVAVAIAITGLAFILDQYAGVPIRGPDGSRLFSGLV